MTRKIKNANHTETPIAKFRGMLTSLFSVTSLIAILDKNGLTKDQEDDIKNKDIPECIKIALSTRKDIERLANEIDSRLPVIVKELYSFLELEEKFRDLYLAKLQEENFQKPLLAILDERQKMNDLFELISPLINYHTLLNSESDQDTEKINELNIRIKKNKPEIYKYFGN